MIWLGTGPVKGFGVTLAIGVFSTMFSVLVTSHLVLEYLVNADIIKKMPMLHLLKHHQDGLRQVRQAGVHRFLDDRADRRVRAWSSRGSASTASTSSVATWSASSTTSSTSPISPRSAQIANENQHRRDQPRLCQRDLRGGRRC